MKTAIVLASLLLAGQTAAAAEIDVGQAGRKFDRPSVTIQAGDSINFLNNDNVSHNITVFDAAGNAQDGGIQAPGRSISITFPKPGNYAVRCSVHPRMRMEIKVKEATPRGEASGPPAAETANFSQPPAPVGGTP